MKPKLLNAAICLNCYQILISWHRHDWVCCTCFKDTNGGTGIFIDGGDDYWRWGGTFKHMKRLGNEIAKDGYDIKRDV